MKKVVHTPEGVRDIYGNECQRKHYLQNRIHDNFRCFGYQDIETPTFEFFDVFGKETGTTTSRELYKFFDKEGNTLVLRPDFTPSIGRCAAKYFMEESMPVRLTYLGNTYTNTSNLQGKLKETTQMGVELIGDASVMADAEMIHLAVSSLKAAGLSDFQISIGEIGFFKGICKELQLDEETEMDLRENISNKNYFGAEELLTGKNLSKNQIDNILKITELFGSYEILQEAKELVNNEQSQSSIDRLMQLYELLKVYEDEKYISFDLGLVSKYHYYTGIIFAGYTFGTGEPIVKGGRYDKLLTYFGKKAPSIGFGIVVDQLMAALSRQKIQLAVEDHTTLLVFTEEKIQQAIARAQQLRGDGNDVTMIPFATAHTREDYENYAQKNHISNVEFMDGEA